MFSQINSFGLNGLDACLVTVEVDMARQLPGFEIVGLPDAAVKESRDRVRSSMRYCGLEFPQCKVVANLAPADMKKIGAIYDLPILMAVLGAMGHFAQECAHSAFVGELSLKGDVRPVSGVLPMVMQAKAEGLKRIFVPVDNVAEGAVVKGIEVYGVPDVSTLLQFLDGKGGLSPEPSPKVRENGVFYGDFCEVKGQQAAKRALEIAAAGGHNALLIGSPGAGKSMLAKRMPSILPPMTFQESIETTKIHSVAGQLSKDTPLCVHRPFRAPHHTVSPAGLSGGGSVPRPGEISLAHNGVLFLDELPEFSRPAMEILRQPMEDGRVTISRVSGTVSYPCSIMVVAAMNPCPCGYFGHPTRPCTCSQQQVSRYLSRVSGPLLDRLDLHIDVAPVEFEQLSSSQPEETSSAIRARVERARAIQTARYEKMGITCNARLTPSMLQEACPMTDDAVALLKKAFDKMGLSARAYDRIVKVARTIADLDGEERIGKTHIGQAVQYRSLDRKYWLNGKN